jgi:hypothetical protein
MDAWSDKEMEIMRVGGNKQMRQFFADQGFPKSLTIEQKYHSEAAGLYRERIKQLAEGANPATLKAIPTIGYKDEAAGAAYSANGSGGVTQPLKTRADSVGSSGGYSSGGGGGSSRSDRSGSFQDDGDSQSSRPKMTGFGSNGQSHSQHVGSDSASADFFGSLSSSFFSAAKYTQQAVAQTAAVVGPKLSQAGATIKAKTVETTEQLKQKDLVSTAAQKTAAGWSAVTSFVGGYVAQDSGSQPPRQGKYASFGSDSLDADGNPKPIQPASSSSSQSSSSPAEGGLFGLPRPDGLGTGKKYEGLGSEQFTGFGGEEEEEDRERCKQQNSKPAQRGSAKSPPGGSSGGSKAGGKSILAQAMTDNEATTADDQEQDWGWNDTPKQTAAAPARKTSPPATTAPVRKSSSGSSFGGREEEEEDASPTKQLSGMKLTSKSTPPPITSTASSSAAKPKAKSILAQIHDDDSSDATKKNDDEFGGFDDTW